MIRPHSTAVLGAWIALAAACVETGASELGSSETGTTEAHIEIIEEPPCDYITCGRNTASIGNGQVDHVYFDGTPNERGQRFLHWLTASGEPITPVLGSHELVGDVGDHRRSGPELNGSVITLVEDGEQVKLRFVGARRPTLPSGLSLWVHRLDVWRPALGWRPLCPLFDHTPSDIARYAILGTREVVHARGQTITLHHPSEGKLTLGCPSSATGKMLSLGALATTATREELSTLPEMRATLLALTLSPLGGRSYTRSGIGVLVWVKRTGLDNHDESLSGGIEGYWDQDGAICFDHLRIPTDQHWELWSQTHVPPCSEVDGEHDRALVRTDLWMGIHPDYPPPMPPVLEAP